MFPEGWALGTPDVELDLSRVAVDVPADGPDHLSQRRAAARPRRRRLGHRGRLRAERAEGRPSRAVLRAGRADTFKPGANDNAFSRHFAPAAMPSLGGWVPGMTPRFFPDGIAQPLPAHTNLIVQLHLHPSGKVEHERGQDGDLLREAAADEAAHLAAGAADVRIRRRHRHSRWPKSATPSKTRSCCRSTSTRYGARGHAHYLAHEMKMTATLPDGIDERTALDQRLGLRLAGLVLLQDADHAAERHADRLGNRLRQLRDQPAQPELAAQAREVGARDARRDGQHDAARDDFLASGRRNAAATRLHNISANSSPRCFSGATDFRPTFARKIFRVGTKACPVLQFWRPSEKSFSFRTFRPKRDSNGPKRSSEPRLPDIRL